MKTVILTSSIFYLLGLKMSQNVESAQKIQPELISSPVVKEQVEIKAEPAQAENSKTLQVKPAKECKIGADSGVNNMMQNKTSRLIEKMD